MAIVQSISWHPVHLQMIHRQLSADRTRIIRLQVCWKLLHNWGPLRLRGKSLTWMNNRWRDFPLKTQFSFWVSWSLLSGMNEHWKCGHVINELQAWSSFNKMIWLRRSNELVLFVDNKKNIFSPRNTYFSFYCSKANQSLVFAGKLHWKCYD